MTNKNSYLIVFTALLTISLAGCGGGADDEASDKQAKNADEEKEVTVIPVEVAATTRGDIFAAYAATASLEALEEADVVAKVRGEVREILVEEGDPVKRNQVLARLDGDRLRLQLEQSRANLAKLQADYRRNVELHERGIVAAGAYESIKHDLEALRASYELAKLEYAYTTIRAPIDGVISQRYIKIGNTIDQGTATFKLTALSPLVAYLYVPEREFGRIKPNQIANLTVDALPGENYVGTIARINPTVDAQTGTFKVTIEFNDEALRLKPGMFGRFSVIYDRLDNTMLLPRAAVMEYDSGDRVYVVKDGVASLVTVTTGYVWKEQIAILDGINEGDRIVTVGQTSLKDGSKVKVIGDEPPEPEPDTAEEEKSPESLAVN